jgi:hypothetical protein
MNAFESVWPYLVLILVGFLPSDVWRMLGIVAARGLNEESEVLLWVRAVATAVLAGVIAKIVFFPPETLAAVPLAARLASMVVGFGAFLLARKSVFAGVATGEVVLLVAGYWLI